MALAESQRQQMANRGLQMSGMPYPTVNSGDTLTTDSTTTIGTGTAYMPMKVNNTGAIWIGLSDGENNINHLNFDPPKPRFDHFIDELKHEIKEWHGDCLRT